MQWRLLKVPVTSPIRWCEIYVHWSILSVPGSLGIMLLVLSGHVAHRYFVWLNCLLTSNGIPYNTHFLLLGVKHGKLKKVYISLTCRYEGEDRNHSTKNVKYLMDGSFYLNNFVGLANCNQVRSSDAADVIITRFVVLQTPRLNEGSR